MYSYRIKYRYNPTGLIKVFTVEAESEEAAKAIIVSDWDGVVMECEKLLVLKESDLANNPPKHPGLQDLDLWTEDQMRAWIKEHAFKETDSFAYLDEHERQQRIDDENHQHDLENGTVPQGSHGYEEQERHREGGVS